MSRFFRLSTDQQVTPMALESSCAGPVPSACWLIGGGPSLAMLPCAQIAGSPAPKLAVNLAGTRLIRPNFWTAYDPTVRFHRSVYLDAGIVKFLPRPRAMDLVPETHFKVCDCPQTCFFDRDPTRGYHNWLSPDGLGIVDWADSLVQGIEILYRLGFRRIYLAGCELCVRPSQEWITRAAERGVPYADGMSLPDFVEQSHQAGLTAADLQRYGLSRQYHFDEEKPFDAAVRTDAHYFRVANMLRLCRWAMSTAGLQLISVTPRSRLNHWFEYQPAEQVLDRLRVEIGDPQREPTRGLYTQTASRAAELAGMQDFPPPGPGRHPPSAPRCSCRKAHVNPPLSATTELIVEEETWQPVER